MWQLTYWHWWTFSLVLLSLEMLLPGTYFLWLSASAVLTGCILLVFPALSLQWCLLIFSVSAITTVGLYRSYLRRHPIETEQPFLNVRGAEMIGRIAIVSEAITHGTGRIRVGDSTWPATGKDCPAGSQVKIVGIQGICFQTELCDKVD